MSEKRSISKVCGAIINEQEQAKEIKRTLNIKTASMLRRIHACCGEPRAVDSHTSSNWNEGRFQVSYSWLLAPCILKNSYPNISATPGQSLHPLAISRSLETKNALTGNVLPPNSLGSH